MKWFILALMIVSVKSIVRSCPKVKCNETDLATDADDNDWCMKVNYNTSAP